MKRALLLGLAATACCDPLGGREPRAFHFETTIHIDGVPEPLPFAQSQAPQLAALTKRASADLQCPTVTISRRRTMQILRAEGCSRQRIYLRVFDMYDTHDFDHTQTRVWFFDLSTASADAAADLPKSNEDIPRALLALSIRGAADLGCPREQVLPEMNIVGHRSWVPVAEGCGRRATYETWAWSAGDPFELRLASKVDASDVGSGFTTWDGSGYPFEP
jgi:hypothetical protein